MSHLHHRQKRLVFRGILHLLKAMISTTVRQLAMECFEAPAQLQMTYEPRLLAEVVLYLPVLLLLLVLVRVLVLLLPLVALLQLPQLIDETRIPNPRLDPPQLVSQQPLSHLQSHLLVLPVCQLRSL
jgi:hypothetical protein